MTATSTKAGIPHVAQDVHPFNWRTSHGTQSAAPRSSKNLLEQRQDDRPENATQTQRDLGYSLSASGERATARIGSVQSGNRQQTSWMRPSSASRSRHCPRRSGPVACHDRPEQNPSARSIRDHPEDSGQHSGVDDESAAHPR